MSRGQSATADTCTHLLWCSRWRNSFLFSLVFGIPVMVVMIYGMVSMAAVVVCTADDVNATTAAAAAVTVTTAAESSDNCGSHSVMLLPGLSLENLLLFLLCTPCQVGLCLCCLFTCDKFYCRNLSCLLMRNFLLTIEFL